MTSYKSKILSQSFFQNDPIETAKSLLGKYLVRELENRFVAGKIVETEAYLASRDPAAHSYNGKTTRTQSLFKPAGHAYVHSMRQHCLLDIVVEGGSVLIRALEPVDGIEIMKMHRGSNDIFNLCSGPGKLCKAFDITRALDGIEMTTQNSVLFTADLGNQPETSLIITSPRIGISKAKDELRRFYVKDNAYVSRTR